MVLVNFVKRIIALGALGIVLSGSLDTVWAAYGKQVPAQQGQIVYTAKSALQSPEQILSQLKSANAVPAEMAPTVEIQKSSTLNASTNGQGIVITSGLWNRLSSNDERAFVISHELSHVVLNHIAKTQIRRVGLSLLDGFIARRYVAQGSFLDLAKNWGFELYDKRSGRVYEYQADDVGIQLMMKAHYNPQGAIGVFRALETAAPAGQVPEFLQDHPITKARIQALVNKYKLAE